jgi:hypothetical protein
MNSLEESVNQLFQILNSYDKLSDGLKELFLKRRETLAWGSYGKDGKQPRKEIAIKDLSDLHICAILETQLHIKGTPTEWLLKIEQSYRKEKGIEVIE